MRDRGTESGRNRNGSPIYDAELVRAYGDKRRALRRKNDDGKCTEESFEEKNSIV